MREITIEESNNNQGDRIFIDSSGSPSNNALLWYALSLHPERLAQMNEQ
ncbi:hypothetical protein [Thaumasiovibrio subtropicus]|nr:hypothetical protein [Thaumasiovibrio subtropicus]